MSKLYFKYGAMGSSKTAQALMTRFNYEEKGKAVWLIKPATDTRDDEFDENGRRIKGVIKSRIGLSAPADIISQDENIRDVFNCVKQASHIDVIIADEAQFFSEEQISQLRHIVSLDGIPVICFGLRTDFRCQLFPGSRALFELADSISEIKSICNCGEKAIVNARVDAFGNIVTEGNQVDIGGNEKYEGMCWKCWLEKRRDTTTNP